MKKHFVVAAVLLVAVAATAIVLLTRSHEKQEAIEVQGPTVEETASGGGQELEIPAGPSQSIEQDLRADAETGLKSYREADYRDDSHEGYLWPEVFSIGLRNYVFSQAEARAEEVRQRQIVRLIASTQLVKVEADEGSVKVTLDVLERETVAGSEQERKYRVVVTLVQQDDMWLVAGFEPDPYDDPEQELPTP